jgi:hypothetical protein
MRHHARRPLTCAPDIHMQYFLHPFLHPVSHIRGEHVTVHGRKHSAQDDGEFPVILCAPGDSPSIKSSVFKISLGISTALDRELGLDEGSRSCCTTSQITLPLHLINSAWPRLSSAEYKEFVPVHSAENTNRLLVAAMAMLSSKGCQLMCRIFLLKSI